MRTKRLPITDCVAGELATEPIAEQREAAYPHVDCSDNERENCMDLVEEAGQ